jgi:hypothetical protein
MGELECDRAIGTKGLNWDKKSCEKIFETLELDLKKSSSAGGLARKE